MLYRLDDNKAPATIDLLKSDGTTLSGQLEIIRQGGRMVFDLASNYTKIETTGRPGSKKWKVHFIRPGMAQRERRREVELARLLADRLHDARPRVAGVHAPQGRQPVEHLPALRGGEVHVLRRGHELGLRLEAPVVGERHPVRLEVERAGGREVALIHEVKILRLKLKFRA